MSRSAMWLVYDVDEPEWGALVVNALSERDALREGYIQWYGSDEYEELDFKVSEPFETLLLTNKVNETDEKYLALRAIEVPIE